MRVKFGAWTLAWCLVGGTSPAWSHEIMTTNNNSTITVDPHSVFGLREWTVDGTNHMFEQQFWVRRVGVDDREISLNTLALVAEEVPAANQIALTYSGAGLQVDILYTLVGGASASGKSRIDETLILTNLGNQPLLLALFAETDLDVNDTLDGDVAFGGVGGITQTEGATTVVVAGSPTPNAFQIAPALEIFTSLEDAQVTNLNNSGSPSGPGDVAFAFQWNLNVPAGGAVAIALNKQTVAAPSTLLLLGFALAWLGARALTRQRRL
jgi:hypothetical protein